MTAYQNFDLRIRADGDQFVVSAESEGKVASEPFAMDLALSKSLRFLEGAAPDVFQRHGADLFDALIHGRVRDLYQQGRGHANGHSSAGLRIRLFFDPSDRRLRTLIRVPWEIVRDRSADANDYPALDSRRPIVRMIDTVEQPLIPDGGRLQRVLLALANPSDSDQLNLGRECAAVQTALARIPLQAEVLRKASRNTLFESISDTCPQIVHFMGHSDVDCTTGKGVLLLENEEGQEDRLPGQTFASFFIGKPAPRLVILTSCLSALPGREQPFAGIACALVAAGLPAVVAMQSEIRDTSAIRFTERLYRRLADGDPTEAAVADARKALSIGREETLDWAAPVLFMRDVATANAHVPREEPIQPALAPAAPQLPIVHMHNTARDGGIQVNTGVITGSVHNYYRNRKPDEP